MPTSKVLKRKSEYLETKTRSGNDNISSKLLKILNHSVSTAISIVINKSLSTGTVPNTLKIAKVIPIYKAKDKTDMGNYRPISLLPSISKVLEKIVHSRLYKFLTNNKILSENQFGFRPSRSTVDAVCKLTSDVLSASETNQYTLAVLLDLSKAFDTINHEILLNKLNHYGIRGVALEWFRSYLTSRRQFVSYHGCTSASQTVTCGVPQGSVLGPLLFIIYTNDLPVSLEHSKSILFADDITLYHSHTDKAILRQSIEHDLKLLNDWFCSNKLSLNVPKTHFMVFCPKKRNDISDLETLNLGDKSINRVNTAKFLGIYIDDELEWGEHIDHVANKLASGTYAINSAKKILSTFQSQDAL